MSQYNFVIVRTGGGRAYANRIARSIHWINENKRIGRGHNFNTSVISVNELSRFFTSLESRYLYSNTTLVHSRAAYPDPDGWMRHLTNLELAGFEVVNKPDVLMLTSNKLECATRLQDHFPHPRTWEYSKSMTLSEIESLRDEIGISLREPDELIAKPLTSMEQGANVKSITNHFWTDLIREDLADVPGNKVIIQEKIPYTAIYRVIVIGGRAMPYSFVDRPTPERWKVSVCLNRTSMEFVPNPSPELLRLGERVQEFIGGEINFIDFFEIEPGNFVISEINTACNLRIHELLARDAGHPRWNIHYNIAKYLVERTVR